MKKISSLIIPFIALCSCNNESDNSEIKSEIIQESSSEYIENPKVKIVLSNEMEINLELYPKIAPITVENFLNLVDENYYDGVIFHRVIENFMIQTGGFFVDGTTIYDKEKRESIFGEFSANGFENSLKHEAGVISMARTKEYNSASNQFFICSVDYLSLDGNYAAFGKVIDEQSLANVIEISKVETINIGYGFTNFPAEVISIETILRMDNTKE